jgi:putative ABC transport system permease protein
MLATMNALSHDVRYAARGLLRGGSFAPVTILTLGLGIGAVTALFAVVDAVLLAPIVPDQDRVVRVSKVDTKRGDFPFPLSLPEFAAWRDQSRSFEALAAVDHQATGNVPLSIDGRTSPAQLAPVSAGFFRVVHRGEPLHGRWLRAEDEQPGAEVAAVVGERFWRRAAGANPAFVGRRLTWSGDRTLLVVGIAPAQLDYPLGTDLWAPGATVFDGQAGRFDARDRTFFQFELIGRLAPGVSRGEALAELSVIHRRVAEGFPKHYTPMRVRVEPLLDTVVGESRSVLLALFAAAGLVFAIAGVNVAALLLMRASGRRTEVAVRIALGARPGRLLRQAIAEGLVLGAPGAVCGLLVALALLGAMQRLAPGVPRIAQAAIDMRVLAFCVVSALSWVLALGTAPVWAHRRMAHGPGVERSFTGARRTGGLLVFTIAEVAAAVVVATCAGLLVRTFARLQAIDRGFDSNKLLWISLFVPEARQRDARAMLAFYDELLPRLEALPGVVSAAPVHVPPGSGTGGLSAPMVFEGQTPEQARSNPWATWEPVLPSHFRTLGIPIVRGRGFTSADRRGGQPVAVVSEAVARRYWPGKDPIGKRVQLVAGSDFPWMSVVGVAADTRYRELTKSWMTVYFPADQSFFFQAGSLAVRTDGAPGPLAPAILQAVRTLEPVVTVKSASTMDALLAKELSRPATALAVAGALGLMAVVLAAVGVYGVTSYEVQQRRPELAVRSALGATPADIFRDVVRRSLIVGCAGAAVGLAVAASVTHTLRSLLYEVQPRDPGVFMTGASVLLGVVLIAACFPARRAAGADPVAAIRAE